MTILHLTPKQIMTQVHKQHARDPNFPITIIQKIEEFLGMKLYTE